MSLEDTTPPSDLLWTRRIHGIVGLILSAALAVTCLVRATDAKTPDVAFDDAIKAIQKTPSPHAPTLMLSRGHEEIIWQARGALRLQAPWVPLDTNAPEGFITLMRDPVDPLKASDNNTQSGPWVARLYAPTPTKSATANHFEPMLAAAKVVVVSNKTKTERRCDQYRFGRWFCGPQQWHFVGITEMNVSGKSTRCMWMHPHDNAELRVTFPNIPRDRRLKGRIAFSDEAAASPGGSPVHFKIELDNNESFKRVHNNRRGWSSFQLDLRTNNPKNRTHTDLTLVVTAPQTGRRHFCLTASILANKASKKPKAPTTKGVP